MLAAVPPFVDRVVVVDNGSTDWTGEVARERGAEVVIEPIPGYGRACLAGIALLRGAPPDIDQVGVCLAGAPTGGGGDPSDEFRYLAEFGMDFTGKLYGRVKLDGILSMDNGLHLDPDGNPTITNNFDLGKRDVALGYQITPAWGWRRLIPRPSTGRTLRPAPPTPRR